MKSLACKDAWGGASNTTMSPTFVQTLFEELHRGDHDVYVSLFLEYGSAQFKQKQRESGIDIKTISLGVEGYDSRRISLEFPEEGKIKPILFSRDIITDAAGLDFCSNALYYDPFNKVIIDPTGRGLQDAQYSFLRFTGEKQLLTSFSQTRAGKDSTLVQRFWKFRLRGFRSNRFTTKVALLYIQQRWSSYLEKEVEKIYQDILRMLPAEAIHSRDKAMTSLQKLQRLLAQDQRRIYGSRPLPIFDGASFIKNHWEAILDYLSSQESALPIVTSS